MLGRCSLGGRKGFYIELCGRAIGLMARALTIRGKSAPIRVGRQLAIADQKLMGGRGSGR